MNALAERYVKLVLALGQHDADYVDAYYGPPEWRKAAETGKRPLGEIDKRRVGAAKSLAAVSAGRPARRSWCGCGTRYLTQQLERAARAGRRCCRGRKLTFDEESKALYDAVAPTIGPGGLRAACCGARASGCRARARCSSATTRSAAASSSRANGSTPRSRRPSTDAAAARSQHVALPAGESFTVEYVTDKSWSGYNWYQGNYRSLIQVNTDLPIYVDRAIDLACHEGYPGPPRLQRAAREEARARSRLGRVLRLSAVLAAVADRRGHRELRHRRRVSAVRSALAFERSMIFPAAGLDPAGAADYYDVLALVDRLSYAGNEAARRYINGEIDAKGGGRLARDVCAVLAPRARAAGALHGPVPQLRDQLQPGQGHGEALRRIPGRHGVECRERWQVFEQLLSSPRLPSGLSTPSSQSDLVPTPKRIADLTHVQRRTLSLGSWYRIELGVGSSGVEGE